MKSTLTSDSWSSCLSLPGAWITAVCHYAQLTYILDVQNNSPMWRAVQFEFSEDMPSERAL
jgi:hypothetical protein